MSFIDNLQKKPKKVRILIVWTATICVMIIIVMIWLFSFSKNLGREKIGEEIKETKLPSLFESIGKDFSIFKQELEASFKSIKDLINEGQQGEQQEQ